MEKYRFNVRITPRASRNEISGWAGEVLRVRVTAPPVEGKANEALTRLLAKHLKVPRSAVQIMQGTSARDKVIEVTGLTENEAQLRLRL